MSSHRVGPQGAAVGPLPPQGSVGQPMWNPPQGLASSSFVPTDIAGCLIWLDFNDISTLYQDNGKTTPVTSDGDVIGAAEDKSGNGNDFTQGTAAARPTYQTAEINSLAVSEYDGTDDGLVGPTTPGVAHTVFAVMRTVSGYGNSTNILYWDGAARVQVRTAGPDTVWYRNEGGSTESLSTNHTSEHVFCFKVVSSGSLVVYVDGSQVASFDPDDEVIGGLDNFYLGRGAAGNACACQHAEFILYNSSLSDANRGLIEDYLGAKWGITVA